MSECFYKIIDDETWCLMTCKGDDAEIILPDARGKAPVTVISDDVFKGHRSLTHIHLPAQLKALGGFVFDGCENLKTITLPETLTDIWQYAFVRCGITEIEIPGSVKDIIPFVFKDCKALKRVVCRRGLANIYGRAFDGCVSLEEILVPEETKIHEDAFTGCPDVKITRF